AHHAAALCRLVGPRQVVALPDGSRIRAHARRRRLAAQQPADPRAGAAARLAGNLPSRRHGQAAREVAAAHRLPGVAGEHATGRRAGGGDTRRARTPRRPAVDPRARWPRTRPRTVRLPDGTRRDRRLARTRRDPHLARAAVQPFRRLPRFRRVGASVDQGLTVQGSGYRAVPAGGATGALAAGAPKVGVSRYLAGMAHSVAT